MDHYKQLYAAFACILCATLVTSDAMSDVFDETPKCMPPQHGVEIMFDCYKTTTGKDFDPTTTKSSDVSNDVKLQIALCVWKTIGVVSADGKTFDVDKAVTSADFLEADDATKTKLKNDFKECGTKGGDVKAFVLCTHEAFMKDCK